MNIYYENSNGVKLNLLSDKIAIQDPESLMERSWDYDSRTYSKIGGKIKRFYKGIEERKFTISIFADDEADFSDICKSIHNITEYDISKQSPGRIWFNDYYLPCYITESKYSDFEDQMYVTDLDYKIISEYPQWIKESASSYIEPENSHICLSDYAFADLAILGTKVKTSDECENVITNSTYYDQNLIIKIQGHAYSPFVQIGDNVYSVNYDIPLESYLEINTMKKTCLLYDRYGRSTNLFGYRDADYDLYAKLPEGDSIITWNGDYSVEVTIMDERGEPTWT